MDDPHTRTLIIGPSLSADVLCGHLGALLETSDARVVSCDVSGLTEPDATIIDVLARLQLMAQRRGCDLRLQHASRELQELLALAGLDDVVSAASALRVGRQAEERKQSGVEKRGDPDDLPG